MEHCGNGVKAQSAMEYLMTYGWMILLVAVVALVLFSLGILGGSPVSTSCTPQMHFTCQSTTYFHSTGNVLITIAQTTQGQWFSTNVIIITQGNDSSGVPAADFATGKAVIFNTIFSINQPQQMNLPVLDVNGNVIGPVPLTHTVNGDIWAQYTTCPSGSCGIPGTANNPYYYVLVAKSVLVAS